MTVHMGLPTDDVALLLKQGLERMEEDIKSGVASAESVFTSLAEVDAYYFSAKQPDGATITGILFRTRVPPYVCFAISPIVPLQSESARIVSARLPPPTAATKPPKKDVVVDQRRSELAERARRAGDAARAASISNLVLTPSSPQVFSTGITPDSSIPPPIDDDNVPQG